MGNSLQKTPVAGTDMSEEVEQFDVIIIGAGVTGLYQLYRLRQLGLRYGSLRMVVEWAVPGIGIATQGPASTPRLHLWIFVLRGTPAGMGLERTLFRPA